MCGERDPGNSAGQAICCDFVCVKKQGGFAQNA